MKGVEFHTTLYLRESLKVYAVNPIGAACLHTVCIHIFTRSKKTGEGAESESPDLLHRTAASVPGEPPSAIPSRKHGRPDLVL
jgi:hypothetical protein